VQYALGADRCRVTAGNPPFALEFELHFVPLGDDVVHQDIDEGRRLLIGHHAVQDTWAQRCVVKFHREDEGVVLQVFSL
jgi:hypothetical protein